MANLLKLSEKIEKYYIRPKNMYNFDEKGFLISIYHAMKRIILIHELRTRKIMGAS